MMLSGGFMKYIYYIGNFDFNLFNAQAQLVLSNGQIFRELGYEVIYIGASTKEVSPKLSDTKMNVNGFTVYTVSFSKKIKDLIIWKRNDNQIKKLLEKNNGKIEAVVLYGSTGFAIQVSSLSRWCKKYDISFIANCVDVSATSHGSLIQRVVKTIDLKWKNSIFKNESDAIIAVSKYISKYFNKKEEKPGVIIPPLKDCSFMPIPQQITDDDIVRLVYAGIPFPVDGRKVDISSYKDRLDIVLELFSKIYNFNKNIKLDIYGITKEQYLNVVKNHFSLVDSLKSAVYFHGIQDSEFIMHEISKADFTINLRDVNQMTSAGFSTKFVESISCGTPAITTNTSDLSNYLIEGKNGFFIDITDKNIALKQLNEILGIKKVEIMRMKEFCYNSKMFDYRNYKDQMDQLLRSL